MPAGTTSRLCCGIPACESAHRFFPTPRCSNGRIRPPGGPLCVRGDPGNHTHFRRARSRPARRGRRDLVRPERGRPDAGRRVVPDPEVQCARPAADLHRPGGRPRAAAAATALDRLAEHAAHRRVGRARRGRGNERDGDRGGVGPDDGARAVRLRHRPRLRPGPRRGHQSGQPGDRRPFVFTRSAAGRPPRSGAGAGLGARRRRQLRKALPRTRRHHPGLTPHAPAAGP